MAESEPDDIPLLIQRARRRDETAVEALYRRTITPVYRYLSARLVATEDVEELTQEVFLAAVRGIDALRAEDEPALLAWLFQIARHKLADHLRDRYRHPSTSIAEAATLSAPDPGPDELALASHDQQEVRRALSFLTDDQREVIVCKYVLGYDNERTGRVVGKNVNAVNQLHHRALASLHRLLQGTAALSPERARGTS